MSKYSIMYHHCGFFYKVDGDKNYIYGEQIEYVYDNLDIMFARDMLQLVT